MLSSSSYFSSSSEQISVNVLYRLNSKKVTLLMNRSADSQKFSLRGIEFTADHKYLQGDVNQVLTSDTKRYDVFHGRKQPEAVEENLLV